ncbi:hypothetical protein LTR95_001817 [Oleoguttula sp. CCFEE 5521]
MAGDMPWPEVAVGNANHANTAVVIIGAGLSGMCTAIDLIKRNNCRNFIIVEKSGGIGGTWHDNKYPGCCCDVWSTLYSYSFAQNSDWTREYPGQEEILAYLVKTAQEYGLYKHVRFNTSVENATWDDAAKKWRVKVKTAEGSKDAEFNPEYEIVTDFLVSAVGQLNQPKWPEIEGIKDFKGRVMHSARWDWSYDLKDKKIAVLGNGCTSAQIIPEVVKVAKSITVFQRTPNWVIPRGDAPVSSLWRNVYKYVPPIRWRKRAAQMDFREAFYDAVIDGQSALAGEIRRQSTTMMQEQLPGREDLWEVLTPKYNPGCKRVIISDDYFPTIANPKVSLETRPIEKITASGVTVKDKNGEAADVGTEFDLLVCATGFQTTEFLHPIELTGKNGRTLSDVWKDGAQAYYGVTVEDMPNCAMLYGPNTNLGHNSIILMIESQSRYINGLISPVLNARRNRQSLSISPKPSKIAAYNEKVQKVLMNSSFADPACKSWYRNEAGLITNNWSGTVIEYQDMLSKVELADYEVEGTGKAIVEKNPVVKVGRVVEETQVSDRLIAALSVLSVGAVAAGWLMRNSKYLVVSASARPSTSTTSSLSDNTQALTIMEQAYLTPMSWRPRPMDTSTQPELRVPTPTSLSPVERDAAQTHLEEARQTFMCGQMAIMGQARAQDHLPSADLATQNFVLRFLLREQEVKIQGLEEKSAEQTGHVGDASIKQAGTSQVRAAYNFDNIHGAPTRREETTPRPFLLPPIEFAQNKQGEKSEGPTLDNTMSQTFAAQLNAMPFSAEESEQSNSATAYSVPEPRGLPLTPGSDVLCRYPRGRKQRVEKKRKPVPSVRGVHARAGLRGFVNWKGERVVPPKGAGSVLV